MKKYILLTGIFFIVIDLNAQENKYLFNEYGISINKTNFKDEKPRGYQGIKNKTGFGCGMYSTDRANKTMNIRVGVEFNHIRYFYKSYTPVSRRQTPTGFSFSKSFISFPLGLRYNIGKSIKFFVEAGLSAEIAIWGNKFKKGGLSSDAGIYGGLGLRKLFNKKELIVKTDMKSLVMNTLLEDNLKIYSRLVISYSFN